MDRVMSVPKTSSSDLRDLRAFVVKFRLSDGENLGMHDFHPGQGPAGDAHLARQLGEAFRFDEAIDRPGRETQSITMQRGFYQQHRSADGVHLDLIAILQKMGAIVTVEPSRTIFIEGVESLRGYTHRAINDRNEAASWAPAALATNGDIFVEGAKQQELMTFLDTNHPGLLKEIAEKKDIKGELTERLKKALEEFAQVFQAKASA